MASLTSPWGTVIPASDLFRALAQDLVGSSVLLNEINTRIRMLDDGSEEGRLKADLCGLAFLIGKLPREEGADQGVRADATTLADLLLDHIGRDSGTFRTGVVRAVEALAEEGVLMRMADEYRIQTREGTEWERAFREERTRLAQSEVEIAARRDQLLGEAVQLEVRGMQLPHGEAKVRRRVVLHFGAEDPAGSGGGADAAVRVWVRDGWSCSEAAVRADARRMGMEDAVLHVHLPKRSAEELRGDVTSVEAARKVLAARGVPSSPEGQEARESMNSRLRVPRLRGTASSRRSCGRAGSSRAAAAKLRGRAACEGRLRCRIVARTPLSPLPRRGQPGMGNRAQAHP